MTPLLAELTAIAGDAFAAEGLSREFGQVQESDRPDLAQFQCNGALAAARKKAAPGQELIAKTIAPRVIAEKVALRLRSSSIFAEVNVEGPGFINLKLTDAALQERLQKFAADPKARVIESGKGKRAVIDFGGMNVAKPMHVGHLRSTIIGDSLQRLFRANGWTVTSDVHLGDWGLQMGQLIAMLAVLKPELPYFDAAHKGPYPDESPVTMDDLEHLYPRAAAACKELPDLFEAARRATAELQAGRPGYRALWQHFVDVSIVGLKREFDSLGVHADLWKGEAYVDPLIAPMIEKLKSNGVTRVDEGALIVDVAEPDDTKEIPPLILVKSDGAVLYGTTDLATIVDRVKEQDPDLILYVVDAGQRLHFEQVFRAAAKSHLNGHAKLEHVMFGTVNGKDGKRLRTRAGGTPRLQDLIRDGIEGARSRLAEAGLAAGYPEGEREAVANAVGIAAIKFADLTNPRLSDYTFDIEKFTRFEGKTGPYLQYAAVRIQSILRKAQEQGFASGAPVVQSEAERRLALKLLSLPDALLGAENKRAPNILCDYVFELAQAFSRFYTEHHIMSETDAALRGARLGLCALTLAVLTRVLDLLGITVPERM